MTREQLHELVWKRFIRKPYGHLLDYADANGNTTIPTPEECRDSDPNALSWGTPIENGAFFGGLYLYVLLKEYEKRPDEALKQDILLLVKGLLLLQDVAKTEGFIARGVATDGVSHYLCSSEDQTFPWILGLRAYAKSSLCEDPDDIKNRILRVIDAVWPKDGVTHAVCKYECPTRYTITRQDWRGVSSLLYCWRVRAGLTGRPEDYAGYDALCEERPGSCLYSRAEIVSQGFASNMVRNPSLIQHWIYLSFHLAVRELIEMDSQHAKVFEASCRANGVTAFAFAEDLLKYDNQAGGFDLNWRRVSYMKKPFTGTVKDAVKAAMEGIAEWNKMVVPHRHMEHTVLGNAIFGLWIALQCTDHRIEEAAARFVRENLDKVDWNSLTNSYAFVAEACLILADQENERRQHHAGDYD